MEIRCMVAGDFFTNCYVVWGGAAGPEGQMGKEGEKIS